MRNLVAVLLLTAVIPAYGVGPAHHPTSSSRADTVRVLPLKDGSLLQVDRQGFMTMRDADGRIMEMEDGVTMELMDDRSLIMKNEPAGVRLHRIARSHVVR